jgi:glycosyltransferase involved in cell wall biosynthesis
MAARMQALGAREVMILPFGLEAMPELPPAKDEHLFFANRGLEPIYAPERVLALFASVAARDPAAHLVVANDGSLRGSLEAQARALGLAERVRFTGRLDAATQASFYARAMWYLSLPRSDAVSVSVLEAMAHGCVPLLSDLPANRELVEHARSGWIFGDDETDASGVVAALRPQAAAIAQRNHEWVREHALFEPAVERFLDRLRTR